MDTRGKFGEHEKCVRVARGAAESNSSFLSTTKSMSKFFYNRATTRICAKKPFIVIECKILTTHKKKETNVPIGWSKTCHILHFGLSESI